MSCDFSRAILASALFTVSGARPFAARCWLTSVTTWLSAALRPEASAAGTDETAEAAALEEAGLDAADDAGLDDVAASVLDDADEEDGAAGLDDAEGVPAVQEVPGVTTTTWEEVPDDGQFVTPDRAELTAEAAEEA